MSVIKDLTNSKDWSKAIFTFSNPTQPCISQVTNITDSTVVSSKSEILLACSSFHEVGHCKFSISFFLISFLALMRHYSLQPLPQRYKHVAGYGTLENIFAFHRNRDAWFFMGITFIPIFPVTNLLCLNSKRLNSKDLIQKPSCNFKISSPMYSHSAFLTFIMIKIICLEYTLQHNSTTTKFSLELCLWW